MTTIDMPTAIAAIGAAVAILGGTIGTGIAEAAIGPAGLGLIAEKPEQTGIAIVFLVIPETIIILSFVVAVLILLGAGII
jgi:V/A-type H+/Na+-transporting ATPase subunit K